MFEQLSPCRMMGRDGNEGYISLRVRGHVAIASVLVCRGLMFVLAPSEVVQILFCSPSEVVLVEALAEDMFLLWCL